MLGYQITDNGVGVARRTYKIDKKRIQISLETQKGRGHLEDIDLWENDIKPDFMQSSVVWITFIQP
jgi:hypothetical protein